jgi:hypothetical protein
MRGQLESKISVMILIQHHLQNILPEMVIVRDHSDHG